MNSSTRNLLLLSACAMLVLFIGAFSPTPEAPFVVKSGMSNVQAQMLDSNLMIWGINTDGSISVDLYDRKLQVVGTYRKSVPDFKPNKIRKVYQGISFVEFELTGSGIYNYVFIRLSSTLEEIYVSRPFKREVFSKSNDILLSDLRIDTVDYNIRIIRYPLRNKDTTDFTALYRNVEYNHKFGFSDTTDWMYVFDSSRVEYAKIFLSRNGRLYVYVNFSKQSGQYIYCFNEKDGQVIYKTRLSVTVPQDPWKTEQAKIIGASESCYYSNYYWNERTNRLMIAGTWLRDSGNATGFFLLQLDESGAIHGSLADHPFCMYIEKFKFDPETRGGYWRNEKTYFRVNSMGYQQDGTFTVLAEIYAQVQIETGKYVYVLQDSFYHYFCAQSLWFAINANSIAMKAPENIVRVIPWTANHHLDSIGGFIPGQTKMDDELYRDDINRLTDPSQFDRHYVAGFRDAGKSGVKVLMRDSVQAGKRKANAYFTKTAYGLVNSNCVAFLSPDPVHEQNFSLRVDYFAANSGLLYRLEYAGSGYVLRMVEW